MSMTIKQMLGQKLIFGFHGTELSLEFIDLLRTWKIGNVILFLRNIESAEQMRTLCHQIQQIVRDETGLPAFIVIDQEGGMVSRLPEDAVNVPCAMALAASGKEENVTKAAEITIRQLRGLGANFNMAPVLDVNNNPKNPVIGIRSFGDDPQRVAQLGCASARAYEESGVLCCAKHFPGHGDTAVDSHLGLPRVEKTEQELEQLELIPFRSAVEDGVPAMMISHVLFPAIVPENVPCTMSRKIVTDLLRHKLGFEGLILTDCMEMGAIKDHYGTAHGVVEAIRAGVDLAEISSTLELERQAAEALNEAAEQGLLDMNEVRLSVAKILDFKAQLDTFSVEPQLCNLKQDRAAAEQMALEAVTCVSGFAPCADSDTFFCGCADYRASGVGNEQGNAAAFPAYMAKAFDAPFLVTSKDPDAAEIEAAVAQAKSHRRTILGTCNGHLFEGQIALANALVAAGLDVTVVALRNPYDLSAIHACTCKIASYDYTLPALRALEQVFRGAPMHGQCPVELGGI